MSKHCIFDSSGMSLNFQDTASYERYEYKSELLDVETYAEIRDEYGIWASNKNCFVKTREELNAWDCKYMEDLYAKYYPDEVANET